MAVPRLDHGARSEGLEDLPGKALEVEPEEPLVLDGAVRAAEEVHVIPVDDGAVVGNGTWLVATTHGSGHPHHACQSTGPDLVRSMRCLNALPPKVRVATNSELVLTYLEVATVDQFAAHILHLFKVECPEIAESPFRDVGAGVHVEFMVVHKRGVVAATSRPLGAQDLAPILCCPTLLVVHDRNVISIWVLGRVVVNVSFRGFLLGQLAGRLLRLRKRWSRPPVRLPASGLRQRASPLHFGL